jgi:hypothetical protein
VKWVAALLILVSLLVPAQESNRCIVADFYGLSWIGEPTLRHVELSRWLTTNGNNCNTEQLLVIWNNLAVWAGTADSSEVRAKVLHFYARAAEREKK